MVSNPRKYIGYIFGEKKKYKRTQVAEDTTRCLLVGTNSSHVREVGANSSHVRVICAHAFFICQSYSSHTQEELEQILHSPKKRSQVRRTLINYLHV